ncbi:hypothetical protein BDN70DRAFT_684131 [Pholiota conissans]|uniref:Uncharacterized protein n=1 Tax=Pholiota conissans TaxID=109636 RepID=A0A9P5Z2H1_9AGAR|nr:hypothetical protein BDN70DRAFT_684131 [Pholiota conissans]
MLDLPDIRTPWLAYRGFEACIMVDNRPVTRFAAEYGEAEDTASAWIACEGTTKFIVYCRKVLPDEYDYTVSLFLDGQQVAWGAVVPKSEGSELHRISSASHSAAERKNLVFNAAALTTYASGLQAAVSAGFGEIKIVLQAVKITDDRRSQNSDRADTTTTPSSTASAPAWLLCDPVSKPVNLVFKYRSPEVLQASGIMPGPGFMQTSTHSVANKESKAQSKVIPEVISTARIIKGPTPPVAVTTQVNLVKEELKVKVEELKVKQEVKVEFKQENETEQKDKMTTKDSPEDGTQQEISDDDDADQIVIKSLRTLLAGLEQAAAKKRAGKEAAQAMPSKKGKIESNSTIDGVAKQGSDDAVDSSLLEHETDQMRPRKKAKRSHDVPHDAEIIDLT